MKATLTKAVKHYGKFALYCGAIALLLFGAAQSFASVYNNLATILAPSNSTARALTSSNEVKNPSPHALLQVSPTTYASKLIDFKVQAISQSSFVLSFNNTSGNDVVIKIYDIIGNLVAKEKVTQKGLYKKEYTLLNTRNEFYIIEVGNDQAINTKRLFLS